MLVTAVYSGSELLVTFNADMQRNDYGVPGSPVWYEPEDVKIESAEILGVEFTSEELPEKLRDVLMELSSEVDFESAMYQ